MIKETISVDETIDFLNKLINLDREGMEKLVLNRVPCNKAMGDHDTVQVMRIPGDKNKDSYAFGFLGVLNGLFGKGQEGYGPIVAIFKESTNPDECGKFNKLGLIL